MPEVPADPVPTKPCSSISKYHASRVSMAPNRMHSTTPRLATEMSIISSSISIILLILLNTK